MLEEAFNKKMKKLFAVVDEAKGENIKPTKRMGFAVIEDDDDDKPEECRIWFIKTMPLRC
jgi:hypothetical protein